MTETFNGDKTLWLWRLCSNMKKNVYHVMLIFKIKKCAIKIKLGQHFAWKEQRKHDWEGLLSYGNESILFLSFCFQIINICKAVW